MLVFSGRHEQLFVHSETLSAGSNPTLLIPNVEIQNFSSSCFASLLNEFHGRGSILIEDSYSKSISVVWRLHYRRSALVTSRRQIKPTTRIYYNSILTFNRQETEVTILGIVEIKSQRFDQRGKNNQPLKIPPNFCFYLSSAAYTPINKRMDDCLASYSILLLNPKVYVWKGTSSVTVNIPHHYIFFLISPSTKRVKQVLSWRLFNGPFTKENFTSTNLEFLRHWRFINNP